MKAPTLLLFLVIAVYDWQPTTGSNILMIAPLGSKSHMMFFSGIAKTLADHGHKVTVIASYGMVKHSNISNIDAKVSLDDVVPNAFSMNHFSTFTLMNNLIPLCVEALGRSEIQKVNVDEYDLVLMSAVLADCFYGLLENKEIPFILMSPNTIVMYMHDLVGNVDFPSFVTAAYGVTAKYPLTFTQRLINIGVSILSLAITNHFYVPHVVTSCQEAELCSKNIEPIMEIASKASLMFINSVRSLEVPARPYVPAVVHAGGLHCRPAKPLPQELQSFIEGSGNAGVIYFSLGSAVRPADMPEKYRKILVNVFASLPQRVLWKWHEETMQDLPANVKLSTWLPQQDILGHPKVKLFISHGGLFSTFETTYHGVPVLGMPVFADQTTNVEKVLLEGYGEKLDWDELTEDLLRKKIEALLTDQRYQNVVKQRSALMRDLPMSPQDTVIYWTEYVIRHKGAPHMRSPVIDMPWYKVYNMDVWTVLLVTLVAVVALLMLVFKWIMTRLIRLCLRGKKHSVDKHASKIKKN